MTGLIGGRYTKIRDLSKGGFGVTELVRDRLGRTCVLKRFSPDTIAPETLQVLQRKFEQEARTLQELGTSCSQIPTLYDYFEENNRFYIVQEWIEGETLEELVQRKGTLEQDEVRSILLSILEILDQHVHAKQKIHRDIKPTNIIIRTSDRKPVLIDFGAVKEVLSTGLYSPTIAIGTPGFMAPEQSQGKVTYASDLYSLGFTAIYLLTAKYSNSFYRDPKTNEVLWKSGVKNPDIFLIKVIQKATQEQIEYRYRSAHEMLKELRHAPVTVPYTQGLYSPLPQTLRSKTPKQSTVLTVSGIAAFVCVIALGFYVVPRANRFYRTIDTLNKIGQALREDDNDRAVELSEDLQPNLEMLPGLLRKQANCRRAIAYARRGGAGDRATAIQIREDSELNNCYNVDFGVVYLKEAEYQIFNLGNLDAGKSRSDQSIALLQQAFLNHSSSLKEAYSYRGYVHAERWEDEEARTDYFNSGKLALELEISDPIRQSFSELFRSLCENPAENSAKQMVIKNCREAIQLLPDDAILHKSLADALPQVDVPGRYSSYCRARRLYSESAQDENAIQEIDDQLRENSYPACGLYDRFRQLSQQITSQGARIIRSAADQISESADLE